MKDIGELRPLTAGRLLELWRECREIGDPLERVLRCNGLILSECCFLQGERVYENEMEALEDLTGRQMELLLRRLAESGGPEGHRSENGAAEVNPGFDPDRFQALREE